MAWEIAKVRPKAHYVAANAAHRAGMTLEEWLDEAIVEHAAIDPSEEPQRFRSHSFDRLAGVKGHVERGGPPILRLQDEQRRDSGGLSDSAVERIEQQISRNERKLSRALEAIALRLEQSGVDHGRPPGSEHWPQSSAPAESEPPLDGADAEGATRARRQSDVASPRPGPNESALRPSRSPAWSEPAKRLPGDDKTRLDLKSAISQIAARRRELDAREARNSLDSDVAQAAPAQIDIKGGSNPASTIRAQPAVAEKWEHGKVPHAPAPLREETGADGGLECSAPPNPLRDDIRALAASLNTVCRADPRISASDIDGMRAEIRAMARSLTDLAPRNAVVALEGAIRDLTQRVDMLRQGGHEESFLAPLDAMAAELRATLKAHDPKTAAAALDREIRSIGDKIDGLALNAIKPESFERIRLQTEEVRNLLAAAAMRTAPLERMERQIGELADRIERLGASPMPHIDSARMAASLDDVRREIERSTPLPTLQSIEQRLEHIATRLDQEIARPAQAAPGATSFDDLARRIDDVGRALESREGPQVGANRLDAFLSELNAKLENRSAEPLAALMRDINAKLDAAGRRDAGALEPKLEGIIDKLDRLQEREADALQSLHKKLDTRDAAAFDRRTVDEVAAEIARRLQSEGAGRVEADFVAEHIAMIHERLDALSASSAAADGFQALLRDLADKLVGSGRAAALAVDFPDWQSKLSAELAELRAERARADKRMQSGLDGLQDALEKLVARLANVAVESSYDAATAAPTQAQSAGFAKAPSDFPASLNALANANAMRPTPIRRTLDPESAADSSKLSAPPPTGEDFLLEPGAGAPQRAQDAHELAQAIGPRTNPAVSAHIAAARRAARAPLGDGGAVEKAAATTSSGGLAQVKALYENHKRSVLLAVALAIVATVAVRLAGVHAPFLQRPEPDGRPVKAAGTDAAARMGADLASAAKREAGPVDTMPTGSIATASEPAKASAPAAPLQPELISAIPAGLPETLRNAILAGSPAAQYELAQRLYEGRELPQDQRAAALWFERAATAGLPPAQFRIGALYQKGVGVARDPAAAKQWYLRAAEAGNARAAHNLAVMNAEPGDGKADYVEAAKWFRKAAELGLRDSQYNLGVLYARGLGVEQDLRQSWLWFSLAAAQGDADAARKRDGVAAKLDPAALAAAADELANAKIARPDPAANDVAAPPGGWDGKPLSQTLPAAGGQRAQATL